MKRAILGCSALLTAIAVTGCGPKEEKAVSAPVEASPVETVTETPVTPEIVDTAVTVFDSILPDDFDFAEDVTLETTGNATSLTLPTKGRLVAGNKKHEVAAGSTFQLQVKLTSATEQSMHLEMLSCAPKAEREFSREKFPVSIGENTVNLEMTFEKAATCMKGLIRAFDGLEADLQSFKIEEL